MAARFFLRSYTACATLCSGEATILVCFSFKKITKNSLLTGWTSAIIYLYLYACLQVLGFRSGMPIHEMGTSVHLIFLTERGLTAMRNRTTLLRAEQSRAEQSRAEQSRAEHGLTAPFLRLAAAGHLKLHIAFVMDNRRILTGLLYPVRLGGFCAV